MHKVQLLVKLSVAFVLCVPSRCFVCRTAEYWARAGGDKVIGHLMRSKGSRYFIGVLYCRRSKWGWPLLAPRWRGGKVSLVEQLRGIRTQQHASSQTSLGICNCCGWHLHRREVGSGGESNSAPLWVSRQKTLNSGVPLTGIQSFLVEKLWCSALTNAEIKVTFFF